VAGVFALSPRAAIEFHSLGVPKARIHPGAYAGPGSRDATRKQSNTVVYCGRLIQRKGLDVLADAAALAARDLPGLRLKIVGEGPVRSPMLNLAARGVDVEFVGHVRSEQIDGLLSEAAALVLPSRTWEGWGYVVNEAVAAGTPAVVSDVVAAGELLAAGRTGFVFRQGNSVELARCLVAAVRVGRHSQLLENDFAIAQRGIQPTAILSYMLGVMSGETPAGESPAAAPWLNSASALGDDAHLRWWTEWKRS
jgi:glycosyltransferase involved in cell wall biosynthesis